jgi:hypothetical protein
VEGGRLGLFWEQSRNFPGGTYENHEEESGQLVHRRRFEPTTSLLQVSSVTAEPTCSVAKYRSKAQIWYFPNTVWVLLYVTARLTSTWYPKKHHFFSYIFGFSPEIQTAYFPNWNSLVHYDRCRSTDVTGFIQNRTANNLPW